MERMETEKKNCLDFFVKKLQLYNFKVKNL